MSYQDKPLTCFDCGTTFTFSATEQEYFASRGFSNNPKRCLPCREARKTKSYGMKNYKPQREMFAAVCSQCGQDTRVPFEPRTGTPVYCSNCYSTVKPRR